MQTMPELLVNEEVQGVVQEIPVLDNKVDISNKGSKDKAVKSFSVHPPKEPQQWQHQTHFPVSQEQRVFNTFSRQNSFRQRHGVGSQREDDGA